MMNQNDDKKSKVSDEKSNQVRAAIYPLAGAYLIYQAYCMYQEISVTSENYVTMVGVSILYALAGVAFSIFGFYIAYKCNKRIKEQSELEITNQDDLDSHEEDI